DEIVSEPIVVEPAVAPETGYSIDGTIVSGEYEHEMTIAGVDVYWTNDDQRLRMGLVSPGTGFVAVGFDPDRQMEGANYIVGSMHEGELTIRDDYGHESFAHMEDTARGGTDDIIASAGNEWPDQTVIEFIIPLDSGDEMDKPLLPGHQYTILVSYHSLLDTLSNRHTRRGSGLLQLDLP
ncbi:DOMON domain-containing protein, partial [Candidatus Bipolaricaulota bacterium]